MGESYYPYRKFYSQYHIYTIYIRRFSLFPRKKRLKKGRKNRSKKGGSVETEQSEPLPPIGATICKPNAGKNLAQDNLICGPTKLFPDFSLATGRSRR